MRKTPSMRIEFKKAVLPDELRSLTAFDRKVFPADYFGAAQWREYQSYWMLLNGRRIGCCAFEEHVDFQDDLREDRTNPPLAGSLYIASTGILPSFQNRGFGHLLKQWQTCYARHNGFTRIVTNTRKGNAAMVHVNRKHNFQVVRTTPGYDSNPIDATVVMELRL